MPKIAYKQLESRIATVTSINLLAPGTTTLYTVPVGMTAIITEVILEVTSASAVTGNAALGVGIASGEDDIFTSEAASGLTAVGKIFSMPLRGASRTAPASSVVKLGVDTAATGTTLTVTAHVFGKFI